MEKTLAVNAGSSSLKWQLYEMPEETVIAKGILNVLVYLAQFQQLNSTTKNTLENKKLWTIVKLFYC